MCFKEVNNWDLEIRQLVCTDKEQKPLLLLACVPLGETHKRGVENIGQVLKQGLFTSTPWTMFYHSDSVELAYGKEGVTSATLGRRKTGSESQCYKVGS